MWVAIIFLLVQRWLGFLAWAGGIIDRIFPKKHQ